jgi:hypothetical protein
MSMPGPYHEFSRQESARRVEQAHADRLAREARKAKGYAGQRGGVGMIVTWTVLLTAMLGLFVWMGL